MLGNDVVDLLDVDARPESFHRRFDARVFTPGERARIARDSNPHALRWAHWAAKEAAYKLLRQRDPRFVFSPIRLEARFDAPASGGPLGATRSGRLDLVAGPAASELELARFGTPDSTIALASFETSDYVHVLARPVGAAWEEVVTAVEPLDRLEDDGDGDPSSAVRRLALREIARVLGVERADLAVGREGRIPFVAREGQRMPIALSLSHHGRFVAFAAAGTGTAAGAEVAAWREIAARTVRRLTLVGGARSVSPTTSDGPVSDESGRDETDDGRVVQTAGAVGCPVRRADGGRKAG